jgi:hypothetical protein
MGHIADLESWRDRMQLQLMSSCLLMTFIIVWETITCILGQCDERSMTHFYVSRHSISLITTLNFISFPLMVVEN